MQHIDWNNLGLKGGSKQKSFGRNWDNVATIFAYPKAIRKAIYTTNAIESLNSGDKQFLLL
jgi:transposase-like protein